MTPLHEDNEKIVLAELTEFNDPVEPPIWQQLQSGDLNLDFETELLFRRLAMKECFLMLRRFVKVMKDDRKEKVEFQAHADNLFLLIKSEEILEKELRVARQRASDLELKYLMIVNKEKQELEKAEEIKLSNKEILDLYKKIEDLEKRNEELVKML